MSKPAGPRVLGLVPLVCVNGRWFTTIVFDHSGFACSPKGKIETTKSRKFHQFTVEQCPKHIDHSVRQCAANECYEELGPNFAIGNLAILHEFPLDDFKGANHSSRYYAARYIKEYTDVIDLPSCTPFDTEEIAKAEWFDIEHVAGLGDDVLMPGRRNMIAQAVDLMKGASPEMLMDGTEWYFGAATDLDKFLPFKYAEATAAAAAAAASASAPVTKANVKQHKKHKPTLVTACTFKPLSKNKAGELAKALTELLRHNAHDQGLSVLKGMYVRASDIRTLKDFTLATDDNIRHVITVQDCNPKDKKRLGISTDNETGELLVRARQGHGGTMKELVKSDDLLEPILAPLETCLHGTTLDAWQLIQDSGYLSSMSRSHIHFAQGLPGESGVISGMRASCKVHIYIDMARAMAAGIEFFESENGVICSQGINNQGKIPLEFMDKERTVILQ